MADEPVKQEVNIHMPPGMPVLYTDSVFVTNGAYGIVLDFAQNIAAGNQQQIVSRLGMSKEHARIVLDVLAENLNAKVSYEQMPAEE